MPCTLRTAPESGTFHAARYRFRCSSWTSREPHSQTQVETFNIVAENQCSVPNLSCLVLGKRESSKRNRSIRKTPDAQWLDICERAAA